MALNTTSAAAAQAAKSAAGAAVTITLAAAAGIRHSVGWLVFGYDATPQVGATLKITDDGATVFEIPITSAGPGTLYIGVQSAVADKVMAITLSAGGGAVLGYINAPGIRSE